MKNIPKICHLCWTKGSPLSLLQFFTAITFHRHNPDWEIRLHLIKQTPDKLAKNTYTPEYNGKDYFPKLYDLGYVSFHEVDLEEEGIEKDKHGILISDILRVKYLYEFGGVYSDFDMLWLRPMSEFVNIDCIGNASDFETTVCIYTKTRNKWHYNASNIVSEKKGGFLNSILEYQKLLAPPYEYQAYNSNLLRDRFPKTMHLPNKIPRILIIAYHTFYPYDIYDLDQLYVRDDLSVLTDKVMGVHWFNGDAHSRKYVDTMASGVVDACSMTSILKRERLLDYENS